MSQPAESLAGRFHHPVTAGDGADNIEKGVVSVVACDRSSASPRTRPHHDNLLR